MAAKSERSAQLSVLDRLIDQEPKRTAEAPPSAAQSLRESEGQPAARHRVAAEHPPLDPGSAGRFHGIATVAVLLGLPDVCSLSLSSIQRLPPALRERWKPPWRPLSRGCGASV